MFKRMFTMIMVMAMIIGTFGITANALCQSEEGRPGVIGIEYLDAVIGLCDLYEDEGRAPDYTIQMFEIEGWWVVVLEGEADEYCGYSAFGIYDHMPDEEEINVLWANRMTDDEFDEFCEQYGL